MCRLNHSTHEKNIVGIINDVYVNEKRRSNKAFFFLLVTLVSVSQMGFSRQCTCVEIAIQDKEEGPGERENKRGILTVNQDVSTGISVFLWRKKKTQ